MPLLPNRIVMQWHSELEYCWRPPAGGGERCLLPADAGRCQIMAPISWNSLVLIAAVAAIIAWPARFNDRRLADIIGQYIANCLSKRQ